MERPEVTIELVTCPVEIRRLKLIGKWTCELDQELSEWYGSRHIWKEERCYKNAVKAQYRNDYRRSNYWLRQGARYHRMKRD